MLKKLALSAVAALAATTVWATDITGAGSTFIYPVAAKWAEGYKAVSTDQLNYQSIGSGAGIKQVENKTVIFAATDMPLKKEDLDKYGLVQWPQIIGGIVPVIRLDGVEAGQMVLDGSTLAAIYLGKIKTWNDPAIAALNPKLKLPSKPIVVVRRADGSGTTFNFTHFLSQVSLEWKSSIGEGTAVEFPVGFGAKGNDGVANNVMQTEGSIGYVEYAYAKQNKMVYTKMINAEGKTVAPEAAAFAAAAAKADWNSTPGMGVVITNQPGADSWPMAASTFILMYANPDDKAASKAALAYFDYAFSKGKGAATELDYISIPDAVVADIKGKVWSQIK